MTLRALIPLKRLSLAKTRLAGVLSPAERRRLALTMATHVIEVVGRQVDDVILLATEPVAELSHVRLMLDAADGLNAAIGCAATELDARPGDGLLVVFADLPLLEAAELADLIAASAEGLAIAPDRLGVGVNAVGFRQPLDLEFCFGPNSRRRFEAEARRLGRPPILVERPGLALDIDDAESLALYVRKLETGVWPG
jgi:2-phospho-L-lactate guanylyltransferase